MGKAKRRIFQLTRLGKELLSTQVNWYQYGFVAITNQLEKGKSVEVEEALKCETVNKQYREGAVDAIKTFKWLGD